MNDFNELNLDEIDLNEVNPKQLKKMKDELIDHILIELTKNSYMYNKNSIICRLQNINYFLNRGNG
jgi:hypothetical protein